MAKRAFKVNMVTLNFEDLYVYIRGVEKSGKTTLFRDLVLKLYNNDATKGLLIGCGKEIGYKLLDNIQAEQVETWSDFEDLVDYLVKNKSEHGIKMVGIDTYDELVDLAEAEVLRIHKKLKGSACTSLNDALGGYGKGRKKLAEIVDRKLFELKQSGVFLLVIGHTKMKEIQEKGIEEKYMQLTSNLNSDIDNIVAHKADVICTISLDRHIQNGVLLGTKRWINFRSDGTVACGARFPKIVDRIELSADNFIKAIEDAFKSASTVPLTDEQFKQQRQEDIKRHEEQSQAFVDKQMQLEDKGFLLEQIKIKISTATPEIQKQFFDYLSNNGIADLTNTEVVTVEQFKDMLDILS